MAVPAVPAVSAVSAVSAVKDGRRGKRSKSYCNNHPRRPIVARRREAPSCDYICKKPPNDQIAHVYNGGVLEPALEILFINMAKVGFQFLLTFRGGNPYPHILFHFSPFRQKTEKKFRGRRGRRKSRPRGRRGRRGRRKKKSKNKKQVPDIETDPVCNPDPVADLSPGDHRCLKIVGIGPFELKFGVRARNRSPGLLGTCGKFISPC